MANSTKIDYYRNNVYADGHDPNWEHGEYVIRQDGFFHNPNGPSVVYNNGDKYWYLYGKLHNKNDAAVQLANGYKEYWLEGVEYSFEIWKTKII